MSLWQEMSSPLPRCRQPASSLSTAFGHPAGHRPGAVFTNDRAARDAKARAYRRTQTVNRLGGKPTRAANRLHRPALANMAKAAAIGRHVLIATAMTPQLYLQRQGFYQSRRCP